MTARPRGAARELALVLLGFAALAAVATFPLVLHLGSLGRIDNGDGQFSIWNVAWVARALVRDPLHVYDANIFHPHRWTLAYSETNLGAGALAIPVYWATLNPYAAHNAVLIAAFVLSAAGMYYLARHLGGDWRAAVVAAITFAFCPYVFGHTPHIQLLMTAGLPFSLLAFHRLEESPTIGRGAALGAVMAAQTYFCGYYAIFVALMIGYTTLFVCAWDRRWRDARYWRAIAVAAAISLAASLPVALPYVRLEREGFTRSLGSSAEFAATWRSYLASPAYAHALLLRFIPGYRGDLLFPGCVAILFGVAGGAIGWTLGGRARKLTAMYSALGVLALWASFGPSTSLYRALYSIVPMFNLLRAPGRFGVVVVLALATLLPISVVRMIERRARPTLAGLVLAGVAATELLTPLRFRRVPPPSEGYRVLASLPDGPVLELPVYSRQFAFLRERYMLSSTIHWKPLIDAYSDYVPPDFTDNAEALSRFPSLESFAVMRRLGGRYAVVHVSEYDARARAELVQRLQRFDSYVAERYADDAVWLYEIVSFPTESRVTAAR